MTRKPKPKPAASPAAVAVRRPPPQDPYLRFALIGVFVATLLRLVWLAGEPIDLYPDEAQYWVWAQKLAWGYFSKPPMVAWMIRATTELFGDGELAVKAGAPVTYVFTSLMVFLTAARLYDRRIASWATIAFITLPAVSISSIIISTDVPLLFFWALATYGFVRAREAGEERWWLAVGISVGFGLLSKYAMAYWLGSALAYLLIFRDERRHLRPFLTASAMGLVIYFPNFLWNWQHEFVSYAHTEANANVHGFSFHPLALAEFAGSQFGVFGPIFFAVLVWIAVRWRYAAEDRRVALLLIFSAPTIAMMIVVASLSRAEPNWSAPAYVTATILVAAFLSQRGREALVQWSVVLHVVAAILLLGGRDVAQLAGHPLPAAYDPLHRLIGWRSLGRSVAQIRAQYLPLKVMGDERELVSALTYYVQPHPFDLVMWNPGGGARNGYELEHSLPDEPGGDYLWITARPDRRDVLLRFQSYEEASHVMVRVDPGSGSQKPLFREVWVYQLRGFKGYGTR